MAMQMWIDSCSAFSLKDLRTALPRSRAVQEVDDMQTALRTMKTLGELAMFCGKCGGKLTSETRELGWCKGCLSELISKPGE